MKSNCRTATAGLIPKRFLAHGALAGCTLVLVAGCTTKAKAKAEAHTAFLEGQQQSMMRMQQNQSPSIMVQGQVRNNIVPWSEDLTVSKAIVAADYFGRSDPREIIIIRQRVAKRIDPKTLLRGEDIPLQAGDILELR